MIFFKVIDVDISLTNKDKFIFPLSELFIITNNNNKKFWKENEIKIVNNEIIKKQTNVIHLTARIKQFNNNKKTTNGLNKR